MRLVAIRAQILQQFLTSLFGTNENVFNGNNHLHQNAFDANPVYAARSCFP